MSPRDHFTAILAALKMSAHKRTRTSTRRHTGPSVQSQQPGGRNEEKETRCPARIPHTAIHRWTQTRTTITNTFHSFGWIRLWSVISTTSVTPPRGAVSQEVRTRSTPLWIPQPRVLLKLRLDLWPQASRASRATKSGPRVWSGRRKLPGPSVPFSWLSL